MASKNIMLKFMCWENRKGMLEITIERGWWIFKKIETWRGSVSGGWVCRGKPASINTVIFLDRQSFKYWEQWI